MTAEAVAGLFDLVLALIGLSIALVFVRLVLGPTLYDRVVALDMIAILAVGFLAVLAVATGQPAYLDVALTLALVGFLATIAFARYAERSAADREEEERWPPS